MFGRRHLSSVSNPENKAERIQEGKCDERKCDSGEYPNVAVEEALKDNKGRRAEA